MTLDIGTVVERLDEHPTRAEAQTDATDDTDDGDVGAGPISIAVDMNEPAPDTCPSEHPSPPATTHARLSPCTPFADSASQWAFWSRPGPCGAADGAVCGPEQFEACFRTRRWR
jgi:hypothetical protein